jgi:hypothetical protein
MACFWACIPGGNDMGTWTLRLGLSLLVVVAFGVNRLPAQDAVPPAQQVLVVPAVSYEPARPAQDPATRKNPSPLITPVDFKVPANVTTSAPEIDFKENASGATNATYRIWARTEYLVWWVKGGPLPVPIVTTGDANVGFPNLNMAGAIGQNGTQVLLGNSTQGFDAFSGMRITLGGWIDQGQVFGIEGNGLLFERRPNLFTASSDGTTNIPLYFPRFNPATGTEGAVPIADPLRQFAGDVFVTSTLQLWGTELNGVLNLWRQPGSEFTLLAGFRYADLRETLQIHNTTTDLVTGNVTTLNDFFGTRNQFYGAQLGGQIVLERNRWSVDLTAKLALGATHQVVDIQGNTTQAGPNPLVPPGLGTFPGGLFAQPSNIGRYSAGQFTILPSLGLNVNFQVTQWLRAYVGYDVMYWNQVVRPGNQMNHSVNLTQNAVLDPNGTGQLVGPAQPAPLFNRTDFWTQGMTFGLEFRF